MKRNLFGRWLLAIPYLIFLILFVLLPLMVVIYYGFTNDAGQFSAYRFGAFFSNGRMIGTLLYSIVIAVTTTVVCLLIAYPVAYILAKGEYCRKHAFLFVFVLPMWINFTLRVTALKEILTVIEGNLAFFPFENTIICMTYDFLPFMIMPLYNSIARLDKSMLEASADLGASGRQTLVKVLIPMTMPGIISGVTMVFLPAMTNYVVLDMIYNSTYIMGSLIGSYFSSYDWNNGSLVSAVLLIFIGLLTVISNSLTKEKESYV